MKISDDAWKRLFNQDILDLLNLVRELEERIIRLESDPKSRQNQTDDSWYWEHG